MGDNAPLPTQIKLHKKMRELELVYGDTSHRLSCEFLRVHSPSAEVRGHGAGQETLQPGKRHVQITAIKPVGNYAIQLSFDDGHDTGLYSWQYLDELCRNHDAYWQAYLDGLAAAGLSRDPDVQVIRIGN
ncbi:MAG TPA: DUF971 domain-containing protein [Spongiibacteraceae bacterium]|jgi:DUF971 family protein|nr:DUF971 domain-containing protein [Spongiibacteraceae bacterium]HUH38026.1 DUF971 domain-containing protein [Spongiibacteraceae bacterium]